MSFENKYPDPNLPIPADGIIRTNDIKRGERIKLRNGWEAIVWDNMKGNTRIALVFGWETEAGSVYSHDIVGVMRQGEWQGVMHTDKQLEVRARVARMGF